MLSGSLSPLAAVTGPQFRYCKNLLICVADGSLYAFYEISFWACVFLASGCTEGNLRTYHSIYFKDKITRKHVQAVSLWSAYFLFVFLANCTIPDNFKESRNLSGLQMVV
jgi:hypothetical protein